MARLHGKDRGLEPYGDGWRARLSINGRMWRSQVVPTKREARDIYDDKKRDQRRRQYFPDQPPNPHLTVKQLFDAYRPLVKGKADYRGQQRFADYWTEQLGTRLVYSLTVRDLEECRCALRDSGRGGPRTIGTVNHYLKCLRHAMRRIVLPRSWVIDLWAHFVFDAPKSKNPVTLSPEQERALQMQLGKRDWRTVRLAILLGVRRGQLFGLRWEWLVWDLAVFQIPEFKTQKARPVPIAREGLAILREMHKEHGKPSSGYLFPHPEKAGLPVVANDWYRYRFKVAAKRAGLYALGVTFHSLRHTWATRQLQAGSNPRTVQRAGAWSSLAMVEKYTQAFDSDVRRSVECAALIGGGGTVTELSPKNKKRKKAAVAV